MITRAEFDAAVLNPVVVATDAQIERLLTKIDVRQLHSTLRPCWYWTASKTNEGYPRFGFKYEGKPYGPVFAHRLVYQLTKGALTEGLQLDHLCEVPPCVNPAHLEEATGRENTLRSTLIPSAKNARKTHCTKGHELSG